MAGTRSTRTSQAGAQLVPVGAQPRHHSFWMRWFRAIPYGFGVGTLTSVASTSR